CAILLGLSSTMNGPGLPAGYPKEQFPLELAVACLDYTEEVETVVSAPGGSVETTIGPRQGASQQGSLTFSCEAVMKQRRPYQNLTSRDFGHRVTDSISERDKAVKAIKAWWAATHPAKDVATPE